MTDIIVDAIVDSLKLFPFLFLIYAVIEVLEHNTAIGKKGGEELNFGGLLGCGPVMEVNTNSPAVFVNRGGRIPAPLQSLKN